MLMRVLLLIGCAQALCCCREKECSKVDFDWENPLARHFSHDNEDGSTKCCKILDVSKCPYQGVPSSLAPTAYSQRSADMLCTDAYTPSEEEDPRHADHGAVGVPLVYGAPVRLIGCRCREPFCRKGRGVILHERVYGAEFPHPDDCDLEPLEAVLLPRDDDRSTSNVKVAAAESVGHHVMSGNREMYVFGTDILTTGMDVLSYNALQSQPARLENEMYGGLLQSGDVVEFSLPPVTDYSTRLPQGGLEQSRADLRDIMFFRVEIMEVSGVTLLAQWARLKSQSARFAKDYEDLRSKTPPCVNQVVQHWTVMPCSRGCEYHSAGRVCLPICKGASPRICVDEPGCMWGPEEQTCRKREEFRSLPSQPLVESDHTPLDAFGQEEIKWDDGFTDMPQGTAAHGSPIRHAGVALDGNADAEVDFSVPPAGMSLMYDDTDEE